MGQSFILFNIDKRQSFHLFGKFGECWYGPTMPHLVFMLAHAHIQVPADPLGHLQAKKETLWRKDSPPAKVGLHSLAMEVHAMIFDNLPHYYQVYSLCLTNTYFWIVGVSRLRKLYPSEVTKRQNLWAGDRIICIGDYAYDLPEEVFTKEELKELADIKLEDDDNNSQNRLWDWTDPIPKEKTFDDLHLRFKKFFKDEIGYCAPRGRRYSDVDGWSWVYHDAPRWETVEGVPYILRNLSKKLYVRADEFALAPDDIDGIMLKKLSFGHLVYSRIAWSSDNSMAMAYSATGNLHRGKWAGDRFDVVRMDQCDLEGWSNVSKEAQKDLVEIWESESNNWKDELEGRDWYSAARFNYF